MRTRSDVAARTSRSQLLACFCAVAVISTAGCAGGGDDPVIIYVVPDGSAQSGGDAGGSSNPGNPSGDPGNPGNPTGNPPPGNSGDDSGSVGMTPYDSGSGGYDTGTPLGPMDAHSGTDSPTSSSCTGSATCDPLANTGCSSGSSFCQVLWDQNSMTYPEGAGTVSCAQGGGGATIVGANCPCGPGYVCAPAIGVCYKLCDLAKGVNNNPDCADQQDQDYGMTTCGGLSNCFGICDATVMLVE